MKTKSRKIADLIARRIRTDYYWEDGGFISEWFMDDLRKYGESLLNQMTPLAESEGQFSAGNPTKERGFPNSESPHPAELNLHSSDDK